MSNGAVKKLICNGKVAAISGGEVARVARTADMALLCGELSAEQIKRLTANDEKYLKERALIDDDYVRWAEDALTR